MASLPIVNHLDELEQRRVGHQLGWEGRARQEFALEGGKEALKLSAIAWS
jgi:hypothetical protein